MTPKQHFRALQIRLEIAEFGMGMPLDRERVKELRAAVEQARKDAGMVYVGSDREQFEVFGDGVKPGWYTDEDMDNTGFGTCDCCGERLPLSLVRTPLGHETWECAECTAQWDGAAELDTMTSDGVE